jgi:hypothetical protein
LPLLALAMLGYLGVLADVGPVENRELGGQLLFLGLPILVCGAACCVLGVWAIIRFNPRRTVARRLK